MKAIVCLNPGNFQLIEKPAPIPAPGEALLRIHRVGICGTDLHAYEGNQAFFTYPRILGHELSAEIQSIDTNEQGLTIGDRVIILPYIHCGRCIACRAGKSNCCQNMAVLGVHVDGGMQEELTLPTELLLPAGKLSHDEIALVEPLSIGAHALRRADINRSDTIVVVGCGPIGIGIMALAAPSGCKIIALDTNQNRLDFVRDKFNIEDAIRVDEHTLPTIRAITNGDLATAVFDATGNRQALEYGPQYLAHGGRYILVGLSNGEISFKHPEIHAKEASVLCSRNATREDFERVRTYLESGAFPSKQYITHTANHQDMIGQFEEWLRPENGVIKAVVNWERN